MCIGRYPLEKKISVAIVEEAIVPKGEEKHQSNPASDSLTRNIRIEIRKSGTDKATYRVTSTLL